MLSREDSGDRRERERRRRVGGFEEQCVGCERIELRREIALGAIRAERVRAQRVHRDQQQCAGRLGRTRCAAGEPAERERGERAVPERARQVEPRVLRRLATAASPRAYHSACDPVGGESPEDLPERRGRARRVVAHQRAVREQVGLLDLRPRARAAPRSRSLPGRPARLHSERRAPRGSRRGEPARRPACVLRNARSRRGVARPGSRGSRHFASSGSARRRAAHGWPAVPQGSPRRAGSGPSSCRGRREPARRSRSTRSPTPPRDWRAHAARGAPCGSRSRGFARDRRSRPRCRSASRPRARRTGGHGPRSPGSRGRGCAAGA